MTVPKKVKLCFITGTRADWGILNPVITEASKQAKFEIQIIAIGMHTMPEFGYTLKEIAKDGFKISRTIPIGYSNDTNQAIAKFIGKAIEKLTDELTGLKSDLVIVLGDRNEMLAATLVANYLDIPVAHIHGGEVSGHIDGVVRHAVTKLSHIHFAATESARQRIIKLGEEAWRVYLVGGPALDRINQNLPSINMLADVYNIDFSQKLAILVQHPVSSESNEVADQIKQSLEAIVELKLQTVVLYPNADSGGRKMIETIEGYRNFPFIKIFKSIPQKDYFGLLKNADILIGNSSSGIIEAQSFKLPVVNIGSRQSGRERGPNVIDSPPKKRNIIQSIEKVITQGSQFSQSIDWSKNPYGDGHAGERIAEILSKTDFDDRLKNKRITY